LAKNKEKGGILMSKKLTPEQEKVLQQES